MKKKSKHSTAKRLLDFEDRWAPDNVSLASIKTSIPTQTMVTVPKLSKKKRSWTMWAVIDNGQLIAFDPLQRFANMWKMRGRHIEIKKVKVTEV